MMTAFNPCLGNDLGLPSVTPPHGTCATAALAGPSLLTVSAQSTADQPEGIPGDTPLLALFRQFREEQFRISGSDDQLNAQEMSASLARVRDLAHRINDEPVRCGEDLLAKFLTLHRVAESTV